MPVGRGWGAAGWGAAGRGRLPSFPLETLVTVPPSLLSVASIRGFIFLFMNLGNLCVFKKKKQKTQQHQQEQLRTSRAIGAGSWANGAAGGCGPPRLTALVAITSLPVRPNCTDSWGIHLPAGLRAAGFHARRLSEKLVLLGDGTSRESAFAGVGAQSSLLSNTPVPGESWGPPQLKV